MRLIRAIYIYSMVLLTIMLIPFMFLYLLAQDAWRKAK